MGEKMTSSNKKLVIIGAVIIALGVGGYFAKDYLVTATKSVEEVKKDVDTILTETQAMIRPTFTITYAQPVVEKEGGDFVVTLSNIKITGETGDVVLDTEKSQKFHLVYEGDNIKITPEIEKNVTFQEDNVNITAEKQEFYAIWSTKVNTYVGGDIVFKNLVITQDQNVFKIENVDYKSDLKETTETLWSGDSKFLINNISAQSPDTVLNIKAIDISTHYKDINLAEYVRIIKELSAKANTPEEHGQAFFQMLTDKRVLEIVDAGGMTLTIKDLNVQSIDGENIGLNLPEFKFAYDLKDLKSNDAKASLEISNKETTSAATAQMGLDPSAFKLQINLDKLPLQSILTEVSAEGQKAAAQGTADAVDYPAIINKNLAQAGTKLNIDALNIDAGPAHLTTKGDIQANDKATLGFEGKVDFTVVGIDDLASKVGIPGEARMFVEMFKGLGKKETKDGKDVFNYALTITPEGKVMLNDVDWGAVLQSLAAPGGMPQPGSMPGMPTQPSSPSGGQPGQPQLPGQLPEQKTE